MAHRSGGTPPPTPAESAGTQTASTQTSQCQPDYTPATTNTSSQQLSNPNTTTQLYRHRNPSVNSRHPVPLPIRPQCLQNLLMWRWQLKHHYRHQLQRDKKAKVLQNHVQQNYHHPQARADACGSIPLQAGDEAMVD